MDLENTRYWATINYASPDPEPCSCSDCSWKGVTTDLVEIGTAHLTPGDESPAGRCPECGSLAYLDGGAGSERENFEEQCYRNVVDAQGWNEASQLLLLEQFIGEKALWREFTLFATRAANEENSNGPG